MDIVSIIASINALLLAFLISKKKQKSTSDKILIAWIFNFAFHFIIPFAIERKILFHESVWGLIMGVFVVTHAPFIYVYTSSLTKPDFRLNFRNLYHFGFILIYIVTFIPYLTLSPDERMQVVQQKQDLSFYVLLPMLTLLFLRVYFLIRTIFLLAKHQFSIKESFSYRTKIDLQWIKSIVYCFLGAIVLSFVLYGLASAQLISIYWMDYILILVNIILFFYIAYSGYKQSSIAEILTNSATIQNNHESSFKSKTVATTSSTAHNETNNTAILKLKELMEKERLYLDPELNIGNVALKLDIHSHQLSKLINKQMKKNFFEFVNEYRVEEFKRLVADPKNKHISILGLAYDAGFNSKATFYRFFKNTTGLTPSEFKASFNFSALS